MKQLPALLVALLAVVSHAFSAQAAEGWKAGAAKVVITPAAPVWMSGYPRDRPAEGKQQDLWAKALALEDAEGRRAVLITLDLVGIDRATSLRICEQLAALYGLERRQIALNVSHTHCGPVVGRNLDGMYALDDAQWQRIDDYTQQLTDKLVALAGAALEQLRPCAITWGQGYSTVAVNRRTNTRKDAETVRELGALQGPSDFDVPVLAIRDPDGKLQAVVFGYACHATVLDVEYKWSGDYPGYAQAALEESHPGAVALFWAGCGGDQAPRPKGTLELTKAYGRRLAGAVDEVLAGAMRPLEGSLTTTYDEIPLRLEKPPGREELQKDATSRNPFVARLAQRLLAEFDAGKPLRETYPYPVQLWQLGDLRWLFLGGEVVVDYALRLKRELPPTIWVAGYSNDVMAYIPSLRVLREGGYEGANSQVYYSLPMRWSEDVEAQIIEQVHRARRQVSATTGASIAASQNAPPAGFTPLFNGRDLTGWSGAVASYEVIDGAIVCKPRQGGVLYTEQEYGDFVVRLEFKLPPGGNNGLAIRYPGSGRPAYDGMCEIQILDDDDPKYAQLDPRQFNGSAYALVPAQRGHLRATGEWNFEEVTVRGSTVKVELNDWIILDTDLARLTEFMNDDPHPGKDLRCGHFGLAGHSHPVQFRNIRIKSLHAQ